MKDFQYYRCSGTDPYRFGGERICSNTQIQAHKIEAAIWSYVCKTVKDPASLEEALGGKEPDTSRDPLPENVEALKGQRQKLQHGIERLIDTFAEGVIDKDQFTVRMNRAKARLAAFKGYGPNTGFPMVLTDNFATNIGPDNTLVFSGSLDLNSPGCAGSAPCLFDIIFQLSTPFLYHKNQGRLLLDISGTAASMAGTVDEVEYTFPPGGPVASVSGDPGDATGGFDSGGIIMQIGYTVPEPSMCALVFCGLALARLETPFLNTPVLFGDANNHSLTVVAQKAVPHSETRGVWPRRDTFGANAKYGAFVFACGSRAGGSAPGQPR